MPVKVRSRGLWRRLADIALWTSSRSLLLFAVYESGVHPAAEGPIPASDWTFFMVGVFLVTLPLWLWLPFVTMSGWSYMRGTGLDGWRWPTAWWSSVAAAILAEGWFIGSAISESDFPLGIRLPGPGDLGPIELLAAFVVAGAAMVTVLVIARNVSLTRPSELEPAGEREERRCPAQAGTLGSAGRRTARRS